MIINTKFGNAKIYKGYYRITSRNEGNHGKYLHRLIFEDFYGFKIPKKYIIHHKNGNKLDNCILNLQLIEFKNHVKIHNTGKTNSMKGKNIKQSSKIKQSKSKSSTGIFRLQKWKNKNVKQGFVWVYEYFEGKNRIILTSVNLDKLKEKVIKNNLRWDTHNNLLKNELIGE